MEVRFSATAVLALAGLAVVGVAGAVLWGNRRELGQAVARAGDLVNPTSTGNVVYGAVNEVVRAATDDAHATLGTTLWDWLNPGRDREIERMLRGAPPPPPATPEPETYGLPPYYAP